MGQTCATCAKWTSALPANCAGCIDGIDSSVREDGAFLGSGGILGALEFVIETFAVATGYLEGQSKARWPNLPHLWHVVECTHSNLEGGFRFIFVWACEVIMTLLVTVDTKVVRFGLLPLFSPLCGNGSLVGLLWDAKVSWSCSGFVIGEGRWFLVRRGLPCHWAIGLSGVNAVKCEEYLL